MSLSCFIFMLKEALKRALAHDSFLVRIMCLARECSSRRAGGWGEAHPPESSAFSEKGEKRKGTKEEGESAGGPTHKGQNQNSPSRALVVQFTANGGEYFANLAHFRCRSVRHRSDSRLAGPVPRRAELSARFQAPSHPPCALSCATFWCSYILYVCMWC